MIRSLDDNGRVMKLFPRRLTFLLLALFTLTAVLGGCGPDDDVPGATATVVATGSATATAAPDALPAPAVATLAPPPDLSGVEIRGNAEGAPEACPVETVAARLQALATAVNNEETDVVPRFFGESDGAFQWYCMPEAGEPFTAYTLDELDAYFQRRYEQNERWRLESVAFNGWRSGMVHFGPVIITRTAADVEGPSFKALGKGAYHCGRQTFVVLCMGGSAGAAAEEGETAGSLADEEAAEGEAETPAVATAPAPTPVATPPGTLSAALPGTSEGFERVGHASLEGVGWHAGLALHDTCAYVGNRRSGGAPIVDVSDPSAPTPVGAIPFGPEGEPVELRVLPERDLLVVADHGNGQLLTFDVSDCTTPRQLAAVGLPGAPHEFHLWTDGERVLVFGAMFDHAEDDLTVVDVTDPAAPHVVARWSAEEAGLEGLLHSVTVSPDGRRAYLALWNGGVVVAEVDLPAVRVLRDETGVAHPVRFPAAHSVALLGDANRPGHLLVASELWTCPFSPIFVVGAADPVRPHIVANVALPENRCADLPADDAIFTAHNALVAGDVAFVTWFGGGVQALDVSDPRAPERVGQFVPGGEGAAEASYVGTYPVQVWSYPLLDDGLLYVVDIQSGLHVVRYIGPGAEGVAATGRAAANVTAGQ